MITVTTPYGIATATLSSLEYWPEALVSEYRERWKLCLVRESSILTGNKVVLPGRMDEAKLLAWVRSLVPDGQLENQRKTLSLMEELGLL